MKDKKKFALCVFTIFMIGIMLLAWPLNLLRGNSVSDNVLETAIYEENNLTEEDLIQQRFMAQGGRLKEISLYIFDAGYEQEGDLEIKICDLQGNIVTEKKEELKNLEKNSFNTISIGCNLQRQVEYELRVKLNSSKNVKFATLKEQMMGATENAEYIYNNAVSSECLAVNYQYQDDFNKTQTVMFWVICVFIYITILWITLEIGWRNLWKRICIRRNLWQMWIILFLISLFNFAAFCSSAVEVEKSFSVMWKVFILWGVTVLSFICLIRKEDKIFIKKANISLGVLLLGVLLLRIPMMDTIQKWDAGEYFYSLVNACRKYEFSLGSFMDNFRLCTHSNLGYSFIMAIGAFFDTENSVGTLTVNLILTLLAAYCLYELLQKYWLNCSKTVAAALTFVISCTPIFLGTFAYINVDYMLALFLIFVIYTEYKEWNILMAVCTVILSQIKETGVVIVAGYFGLKILVQFVRTRGGLFRKIQGCFSKPYTWVAATAGTIYAIMVVKLGTLSGWVQNIKNSQQENMLWSSSGMNCFGFQPKYILYKLMQFFVMNFAWILTIMFLTSIIILMSDRNKRKQVEGEKYIGLVGGLIAFVIFGVIYVTYTLERYNIFFAVGFTILTICLFYHAFVKRMKRIVIPCVSTLGILMLIQAFWNIDVISGKVFGTVAISEKNSMLFSCMDFPYYGDGLVCNYQYSWIDKAFDKLLRMANYTEDMQIIVTRKQAVGSQLSGNGTVYPISWDVSAGKRVLDELDGKENIGINTICTDGIYGFLPFRYIEANASNMMKDRAITYFIPYYQENKEETLNMLSNDYYIGEEKEVAAYGGVIQYNELLKKDDIAGITLGDLQQMLKKSSEENSQNEKFCRELVVDAIEELGWSQSKVEECANYNWGLKGKITSVGSVNRDIIEKYDVIDMEVEAYNENGDQLDEEFIGNVTGNTYENVVVGGGKLLEEIDEALIGTKLGDTVEVVCKIPEKYPIAGEYQGKNITFRLKPICIAGIWQEENGYGEKRQNYLDAEWLEWKNVSKKVEKNIIARTWNSEDEVDEDRLQQYIANIEYAYKEYWEKWGISKEDFRTEYLHCGEDEYQKLMASAAKAMIKREEVDQVLYDYKVNWNFIDNIFYKTGENENDTEQIRLDYARKLTLNEITKEEVLIELCDNPVCSSYFEGLSDEEFVDAIYAIVSGQEGTEMETEQFKEMLSGETNREDIIRSICKSSLREQSLK